MWGVRGWRVNQLDAVRAGQGKGRLCLGGGVYKLQGKMVDRDGTTCQILEVQARLGTWLFLSFFGLEIKRNGQLRRDDKMLPYLPRTSRCLSALPLPT